MDKSVSFDRLNPNEKARVHRMRDLIESGKYDESKRFFSRRTRKGLSKTVRGQSVSD